MGAHHRGIEYLSRRDKHELVVCGMNVLADLLRKCIGGMPHDIDALADARAHEVVEPVVLLGRGGVNTRDEEDLRDLEEQAVDGEAMEIGQTAQAVVL